MASRFIIELTQDGVTYKVEDGAFAYENMGETIPWIKDGVDVCEARTLQKIVGALTCWYYKIIW